MKQKNKEVVLIVLNNFKNDSRVLKEAVSLQNAGYIVKVVALHEDTLKEFEDIQNVSVHRMKLKSREWSKNKVIQLIKYFEFIYRVIKQYRDRDILHCNDLSALPIGVITKRFFNKNVKVVYDAHEYETEINGLRGIRKVFIKWFEKVLIGHADKVVTVSDSIAKEYVRLYAIPKPDIVLNAPAYQETKKKDIFRQTFEIAKDKTIFLYQGGLSRGRGIEVLLDTFKDFDLDKSVIVFMGYGPLESLVQEYADKCEKIYYHAAVSPEALLDYTSSADFGISMIEDICLSYRYCLPNKMFEYMMADIPIIVSNLDEMKKVVEEYGVGVVAHENTVEGILEACRKAANMDQTRLYENIKKVKKIYNWQEQEKVLLGVYSEL